MGSEQGHGVYIDDGLGITLEETRLSGLGEGTLEDGRVRSRDFDHPAVVGSDPSDGSLERPADLQTRFGCR